MRRTLLALGLGLVAVVALAGPAGAHAALESTEPAAGALLGEAPAAITLHFTEAIEVDEDAVRVFDAARRRIDLGEIERVDGSTLRVPLDRRGDGGYVVAWKVVSADGHPIGGGFTFRVGEASTAVDPGVVADLLDEQEAGRAVTVAAGIVRFVVFTSLLLLVGGALFVGFVWPAGAGRARARRLLWWSWAALALTTVLGIGLQGAELGGHGLFDALTPSVLGDAGDTTFGTVWLARLALLAPMAWLLTQVRHAGAAWWRVTALVVGAAVAATPAFSGHADSGRWTGPAKVADAIHVGSAALWLGGLAVLLLVALRNDVDNARSVAERFSPIAFAALAVVVLTGTFQSVRQVTTLDALETSYGRLLAVKVVLVLALVGIASLTRSALQGRLSLDGEQPVAAHRELTILRRLVTAEVAVALVVVAVTTLLVDANPGYATTATAGPFDETVVVDDVLINVVAVPGTLGPTDFHLYVDDPAGGLTPPLEASGRLSSGEIADIPITFVAAGPGHWSAYDVDIAIAATWELTVDVLLTEVDEVSATFSIPIGGAQ